MAWCLLLVVLTSALTNAMYADEPLLYDQFPDGFIWAAATSAHQIEGGWDADGKGLNIYDVWTSVPYHVADGSTGQVACNSYEFYEKDVEALKTLGVSHYRFSISWARVLPDGIGRVNQAGIDYYKRLIGALKAANIEPMVTLYHWDLPLALENMGGWLNPNIAQWFEEYARLCYTEFGNDVKFWITINEPWVIAYQGYGSGNTAPAKYGPGTYTYEVGHNIILAHATAYRLYEAEFKPTQQGILVDLQTKWTAVQSSVKTITETKIASNNSLLPIATHSGNWNYQRKVGLTVNINWYASKDDEIVNADAAERALQFLGGWMLNPIYGSGDYPTIMKVKVAEKSAAQGFNKSRLPEFTEEQKILVQGSGDFVGLNYYTSYLTGNKIQDISVVDYGYDQDIESFPDPTCYGSSFDWLTVTPYGMRNTLKWIKDRFNDPEIIITENGYSDRSGNTDDIMRVYYYKHNINAMLKAIKLDGVRVTGYAAWSLIDNFEWGSGYTQKFGLFSIDFGTSDLNRTAKASARYYAKLVRDNGFAIDQPCNNQPLS